MKLIADIIGSVAETCILFYFYNTFFTHLKTQKKHLILFYILNGVFCFLYSSIAQTPIERSFCFIIFTILPLFFYKEKLRFKIIITIVYFATLGLTELVVKSILLGYRGDFKLFYQAYEYHYFWGVVLSKLTAFILIYCYHFVLKIREEKLPIYLYVILLFVPILSTLIFYFLQTIVYNVNEQSVYIAHCYISFILLLFNLIIFFLFFQAAEASWLKARLTYEEHSIQNQQQYYKNLSSYHKKIRQLYHDMNTQYLILYNALSAKDICAATKYVEKQLTDLSQNKMVYTGYLLLDTIFDYKKQLALKQHTQYTIYSELEPNLPLTEETLNDLSIIIASCVDNALEATLKIPNQINRRIKIRLENDQTYIYLQIENTVYQNISIVESQIPATTKTNHLLHGLGLRNIKNLAEKHSGKLFLDCHDFKFTTGLMIKY